MYKNFMEEAGDIFDKLEIRYHLGTSESGDVCKNSIKRREAMPVVICVWEFYKYKNSLTNYK